MVFSKEVCLESVPPIGAERNTWESSPEVFNVALKVPTSSCTVRWGEGGT